MADPTSLPSEDELEEMQQKLSNRMMKSGEWQRIQDVLSAKLSESGWTDQVKSHAKEHARQMHPLKFDALQQNTADFAFGKSRYPCNISVAFLTMFPLLRPIGTLPDPVKNEILAEIRAYIASQIDESGNVSPAGRR